MSDLSKIKYEKLNRLKHRLGTIKVNLIAYLLDLFFWFYIIISSYKIVYQKILAGMRYVDFFWYEPLYSLLIGFLIATPLYFIKRFSIGKSITKIYHNKKIPFYKEPYGVIGLFVILLTFISGLFITQISLNEFLSTDGIEGVKRIFLALLSPNFEIFEQALFAAIETIYMAFVATVFAIPVAFIISFLAARNLMGHRRFSYVVYFFARFLMNITRSTEPLIWAIIFSVWVGIGPFAGMLALFLHSVASLAKLYSEQIENIDNGPIEAITATGAHPIQVIWYGVVPQIILPFLSFTIYRWDINVRMATVIGLVGGGGIGTMLMQYQGLAKWREVGLLVLIIAFIVWVMDYTSAKIREAIK